MGAWVMPVGRGRGQTPPGAFPLRCQAQPLLRDTMAQAPATSPGPVRPSPLPGLPSRGRLSLIFLVKNIYTIIRDFFFSSSDTFFFFFW